MMRYSDLVAVTRGLRAKVQNQGYREWGAVVLWRGEDGTEVETGEVDLGPAVAEAVGRGRGRGRVVVDMS